MKVTTFIPLIAASMLAWMAGSGCANQQNSVQSNSSDSAQKAPMQVTGSYIPRDINRNGPTTDGANNLRIIDQSEIQRSGGADPNQTLRLLGVH
jgi:hypothetical protein